MTTRTQNDSISHYFIDVRTFLCFAFTQEEHKMIRSKKRMFPRNNRVSLGKRLKWKVERYWREFRHIPRNIKTIIKWTPVLWNNFDYDYGYLLLMLKFKLKCMREHIVEHDIVVSAPKIGKQIRACEDIITRLKSQTYDYIEEERAAHKEKWGESVWDSIPVITEDDGLCYAMDIYTEKAREQGLEKQEREEKSALYRLGEERRQKDLDDLFRIMRDNIESWWD